MRIKMSANPPVHQIQRPTRQFGNLWGWGRDDLIRLLLWIIQSLLYQLGEGQQIIQEQQREIIELQVRLNKVNRVFSPKNEKSPDRTGEDSKSSTKKKRGAQPGHKPTKRNIPKDLKEKKIQVDFDHQVRVTISAIHEIIIRCAYKKDCSCPGGQKIKIAPQRNSVIKKSILSTASWVNLVIMKYFLAVPIYRYAGVLRPKSDFCSNPFIKL